MPILKIALYSYRYKDKYKTLYLASFTYRSVILWFNACHPFPTAAEVKAPINRTLAVILFQVVNVVSGHCQADEPNVRQVLFREVFPPVFQFDINLCLVI